VFASFSFLFPTTPPPPSDPNPRPGPQLSLLFFPRFHFLLAFHLSTLPPVFAGPKKRLVFPNPPFLNFFFQFVPHPAEIFFRHFRWFTSPSFPDRTDGWVFPLVSFSHLLAAFTLPPRRRYCIRSLGASGPKRLSSSRLGFLDFWLLHSFVVFPACFGPSPGAVNKPFPFANTTSLNACVLSCEKPDCKRRAPFWCFLSRPPPPK